MYLLIREPTDCSPWVLHFATCTRGDPTTTFRPRTQGLQSLGSQPPRLSVHSGHAAVELVVPHHWEHLRHMAPRRPSHMAYSPRSLAARRGHPTPRARSHRAPRSFAPTHGSRAGYALTSRAKRSTGRHHPRAPSSLDRSRHRGCRRPPLPPARPLSRQAATPVGRHCEERVLAHSLIGRARTSRRTVGHEDPLPTHPRPRSPTRSRPLHRRPRRAWRGALSMPTAAAGESSHRTLRPHAVHDPRTQELSPWVPPSYLWQVAPTSTLSRATASSPPNLERSGEDRCSSTVG